MAPMQYTLSDINLRFYFKKNMDGKLLLYSEVNVFKHQDLKIISK